MFFMLMYIYNTYLHIYIYMFFMLMYIYNTYLHIYICVNQDALRAYKIIYGPAHNSYIQSEKNLRLIAQELSRV
jgi:hypothetical protein